MQVPMTFASLTSRLLHRGVPLCHRHRLLAITAIAPKSHVPTHTPSQPPASPASPRNGYFPKRGETIELTCETLAFKGKGVCKVSGSTFVVPCNGALPGERLLAHFCCLRCGAFAEAAKLRTIEP